MGSVVQAQFGRQQAIPEAKGDRVADNKRTGFVLMYRSLLSVPFKNMPERFALWVHLMLEASYDSDAVTFNRNTIRRQRGQIVTSVAKLAQECGISEDSARRSLEAFDRDGMISRMTQRGSRGYTVIELRNYDDYQRGITRVFNETNSADLNANLKPAPPLGSEGDSNELGTYLPADFGAELNAEDLNKINNKTNTGIQSNSCPVSDETERRRSIAKTVLDRFNELAGSRYQDKPAQMKFITARLADGYSVDDMVLVAEFKTAHWLNHVEQCQYLRPSTVYGSEKFAGYLMAAQRWVTAGRPRCVNGQWEGYENPSRHAAATPPNTQHETQAQVSRRSLEMQADLAVSAGWIMAEERESHIQALAQDALDKGMALTGMEIPA
jgi:uncharacterized phage protein (TIGR02220 family)